MTRTCRVCLVTKPLSAFARCTRWHLRTCRDCWGKKFRNRSHGHGAPSKRASSRFLTPAVLARRFSEGQPDPLAAALRAAFE